jgi:hypothetical protein
MAGYDFKYKPVGEVLRSFLLDQSFFRGIRGPVGSGTSSACCVEIFRRANEQEVGSDGVRRSRWAIIRNTNPQLKTTTIKTWLEWFPERVFGKFNWSVPYTHLIKIGDCELEVIFLALDRPDDVDKLLSLDLTGVWVNEAREVAKAVVDGCTMRVGRYPSMKDGGPSWYGVIADTNAPGDDHWWPIMAGESPVPEYIPREEALMLQKPADWKFFTQPAGMVEDFDVTGKEITGYSISENAENVSNLPADYYDKIILGKTKSWIDVYVMNRLGTIDEGKTVYPTYNDEVHVAKEAIMPIEGLAIYVGMDFGLTPAAIFGQKMPNGRWLILKELVTYDMGTARFADAIKSEISRNFPSFSPDLFHFYGDPAGDQRAQTDEVTPFQILRTHGIIARPTNTNDPVVRTESVMAMLNRMIDGLPGFLLDPSCKVLRQGFRSGYQYRKMQVSGDARFEDKPLKNKFSHPHDALQYMALGAGEGREVLHGSKGPMKSFNIKAEGGFWQRQRQSRQRSEGRFGM